MAKKKKRNAEIAEHIIDNIPKKYSQQPRSSKPKRRSDFSFFYSFPISNSGVCVWVRFVLSFHCCCDSKSNSFSLFWAFLCANVSHYHLLYWELSWSFGFLEWNISASVNCLGCSWKLSLLLWHWIQLNFRSYKSKSHFFSKWYNFYSHKAWVLFWICIDFCSQLDLSDGMRRICSKSV
jgi:hypothetical protein